MEGCLGMDHRLTGTKGGSAVAFGLLPKGAGESRARFSFVWRVQ
jgi:hypothetical protein